MLDRINFIQRTYILGLSSLLLTLTILLFSISQAHAERLLIGGTGASLGGMKLLSVAYMNKHPEHSIFILPSLGSGGGIKALGDGKINFSLSARPLKKREKNKDLRQIKYAETPFIIVTRQDNRTSDLTIEQLAMYYSGEVSHWPDGIPVRIVKRPPSESDNKILQSMSDDMEETISEVMRLTHLVEALNDQDNAKTLEVLTGSLGAMSLAQMQSEKRVLQEVMINGVKGSVDNIKNGKYLYKKSLYIILPRSPSALAKSFIEFSFSDVGKAILTDHGHHIVANKAF